MLSESVVGFQLSRCQIRLLKFCQSDQKRIKWGNHTSEELPCTKDAARTRGEMQESREIGGSIHYLHVYTAPVTWPSRSISQREDRSRWITTHHPRRLPWKGLGRAAKSHILTGHCHSSFGWSSCPNGICRTFTGRLGEGCCCHGNCKCSPFNCEFSILIIKFLSSFLHLVLCFRVFFQHDSGVCITMILKLISGAGCNNMNFSVLRLPVQLALISATSKQTANFGSPATGGKAENTGFRKLWASSPQGFPKSMM